ncbi:MAG: thioredoxin [bacterium]
MEHEITLTDKTFSEQIKNGNELLVVDFWAPWCAPCRMIAPILSALTKEYEGRLSVAKLNVDENPITAQHYGITGIPTLLLFKHGELMDRLVGAMPKAALESALQPHLPTV